MNPSFLVFWHVTMRGLDSLLGYGNISGLGFGFLWLGPERDFIAIGFQLPSLSGLFVDHFRISVSFCLMVTLLVIIRGWRSVGF